jgi:hypothetical protein
VSHYDSDRITTNISFIFCFSYRILSQILNDNDIKPMEIFEETLNNYVADAKVSKDNDRRLLF